MAVSEDPEIKQENAHLKEIEELVFDQDVILSYKKLSKQLEIHVNKAKRLLSLFVENTRRGKRVISVTYLVSGKETEIPDGSWRVRIVSEADLSDAKKHFTPETLSTHVYSVHQGTKVLDKTALVEAGKSDDGTTCHSAIVNKNAKPYAEARLQEMIHKVQPTAPVQPTTSMFGNKKPAPQKPEKKSSPTKNAEEKKEDSKAKDTEKDKKGNENKGSTISAMFSAQSSKAAESTNKPAASKPVATNKKGGKKGAGSGNIAAFFQRQKDSPPIAKKPSQDTRESPPKAKSDEKESDNYSQGTNSQETSSQSSTTQTKSPVRNSNVKSSTKSKAASKRPASKSKNNKKEAESTKKRKRIIALTDSESSDNEEPEEEMQVDSPPPPVSVVEDEDEPPKPENEPPNSGTYKERRLVDKVYQDEKGFIVTKKEWVVETHKVEEDVKEVKQDSKKEPAKEETAAPPKKKVQSDIMSFFGRK